MLETKTSKKTYPDELFLSDEFRDFAEMTRSGGYGPLVTGLVAIIQEVRRHPKLQRVIEQAVKRLGSNIDLSKRIV